MSWVYLYLGNEGTDVLHSTLNGSIHWVWTGPASSDLSSPKGAEVDHVRIVVLDRLNFFVAGSRVVHVRALDLTVFGFHGRAGLLDDTVSIRGVTVSELLGDMQTLVNFLEELLVIEGLVLPVLTTPPEIVPDGFGHVVLEERVHPGEVHLRPNTEDVVTEDIRRAPHWHSDAGHVAFDLVDAEALRSFVVFRIGEIVHINGGTNHDVHRPTLLMTQLIPEDRMTPDSPKRIRNPPFMISMIIKIPRTVHHRSRPISQLHLRELLKQLPAHTASSVGRAVSRGVLLLDSKNMIEHSSAVVRGISSPELGAVVEDEAFAIDFILI